MSKLENSIGQFKKALQRLQEVLAMPETDVIRDSAIQRFEFTLDLSWKMLKTYLEEKKGVICKSPKECFRQAYMQGIIEYEDQWLKLVDIRNQTVHTYNEEFAKEIFAELPSAVKLFESLPEVIK